MKKTVKKNTKKAVKRVRSAATRYSWGNSKIIILVVIALILAGAGSFYIFGKQAGMPGLSLVKPALNPNCEFNDPELCKFMNNWQNQTSYSVTSTSTYGGETIESMYEISGEDKFHTVSKQNGKESMNMISIGDTTYTLDYTDNKWWKMTYKPEEVQQEEEMKDQFKFDTTETKDNTTYKFIAKESCENRTCFKYEIISPDASDMKQFIWFDDSEYLMRKMRIEDAANGSSESVFAYGNVTISAPSPVKEGAPGMGSMPEGYSQESMQKMMQQYQQSSSDDMPSYDTSDYVPSDDTPVEE